MGLLILLLVMVMKTPGRYGYRDPKWFLLAVVFWFAVGLGLLLRKRWASLVFTVTCGVLACTLIVGSIITVPMPWTLINIVLGAVLASVASLGIVTWRELKAEDHTVTR